MHPWIRCSSIHTIGAGFAFAADQDGFRREPSDLSTGEFYSVTLPAIDIGRRHFIRMTAGGASAM